MRKNRHLKEICVIPLVVLLLLGLLLPMLASARELEPTENDVDPAGVDKGTIVVQTILDKDNDCDTPFDVQLVPSSDSAVFHTLTLNAKNNFTSSMDVPVGSYHPMAIFKSTVSGDLLVKALEKDYTVEKGKTTTIVVMEGSYSFLTHNIELCNLQMKDGSYPSGSMTDDEAGELLKELKSGDTKPAPDTDSSDETKTVVGTEQAETPSKTDSSSDSSISVGTETEKKQSHKKHQNGTISEKQEKHYPRIFTIAIALIIGGAGGCIAYAVRKRMKKDEG